MLLGMLGAPAANAATCYGDYCSGKDPVASGCYRDAITLETVPVITRSVTAEIEGVGFSYGGDRVGQLSLRWSESCGTNWAKLVHHGNFWSPCLRA